MPDDLIARIEAATEPHCELDQSIAHAVGQDPRWEVPEYTASLDAALTLVPKGWAWNIERDKIRMWENSAGCWEPSIDPVNPHHKLKGFCRNAATPALALCIAALKARAAGEEHRRKEVLARRLAEVKARAAEEN